jgi:dTDP-4-amino-4,6-dideoxygalactose transaminase
MKVYCERGNHAFPLSELQAAVLPPQLAKLAERNQRRNRAAARLLASLADVEALVPAAPKPKRGTPVYYKLAWRYDAAACGGRSRDEFLGRVQREGVALDAGFRGFTRRPESVCRKVGALEQAQQAVEQTVVLHHPILLSDDATLDRLAAAIRKSATP